MNIAAQGLAKRQALYSTRLGQLAYERLGLSRRIEEIDREIGLLEAANTANNLTRRDLDTQAAIEAAQTEAATPAAEGVPDA